MSEIEFLERIAKNTDHKTSFQVIVSGNQSSFNTLFNPKIELDRNKVYEIALVNLETYYSFPNIDDTNNVFVYSHDQGVTWTKIKIPSGSYEIDDLNNTIRFELEKRGHYDEVNNDYYINISANSNTLKSILIIEPGYQVDFFALALGISGAVTGGISLIGNIFSKKATTKAEKHLKIKTLATAKLDTIASHISKAMMDDYISDEEFKLIMGEIDKYKAMKEEIRSNTKKKLKTEEEEILIERGRQEARESFRKLVEKNKTI